MALLPIRKREADGLAALHREMDDLFDSFFSGLDRPFSGYRAWPAIDVAEEENEILVRAELPGCKPEDIDISVHGDVLTISGEKKLEKEESKDHYYHRESSYGAFRRQLSLPAEVDAKKVEAQYKDGVLAITLPKAETSKAIKVKVKA